jgi:hypothetical protein
MKSVAIAAGAGSMALVASLALSPLAAHADSPTTTTTTTVSGPKGSVVAGQPVTFVAKVNPFKVGKGKAAVAATGTVQFVITGPSTVACTGGDTVTPKPNGKASCAIAAGSLVASATSYSVKATYAGDDNFSSSNGSTTLTVGQATTHLKITDAATGKPTSDGATTFTATLVGPNASEATGTISFVVTSTYPTGVKANKLKTCAGGDTQTIAAGMASCSLAAGWVVAPTVSPNKATWGVDAQYSGDSNFVASTSSELTGSVTS